MSLDPEVAHMKSHEFKEWLNNDLSDTNWQGNSNESWINYYIWARVKFRDWALLNNVPRGTWEDIYRAFLED